MAELASGNAVLVGSSGVELLIYCDHEWIIFTLIRVLLLIYQGFELSEAGVAKVNKLGDKRKVTHCVYFARANNNFTLSQEGNMSQTDQRPAE